MTDTKPLALSVADIIESRIAAAAGAVLPTVRLDIGAMTIDDATALAALLREAGGWRPIESAPHNEPVLLAWKSNGLETWNFEAGAASHGTRYPNGASSMSFHGQATHWRPLPAPPAAGGKDGED